MSGFPDKMRRRDTAAPELIEFCTSQVAVQLAYGAFIFKNTFNAWNPSVFIEINAAACEGLLLCSVIQLRQPDKDRVIVLVGRQTIQGLMPEHILPPMR